jgi:hypothetical protein
LLCFMYMLLVLNCIAITPNHLIKNKETFDVFKEILSIVDSLIIGVGFIIIVIYISVK